MQVWHDPEPEALRIVMRPPRRAHRRRFLRDFLLAGASFALVLGITVLTARAETLDGRLHVIDGDTVWHYDCPRGARCAPEKIRLLEFGAPETHGAKCEAELVAGLRAKARLVDLLRQRPVRIERCNEHGGRCLDRFGRTLARLHTSAGSVGTILLRDGLALQYVPGAKAARTAHWCEGRNDGR